MADGMDVKFEGLEQLMRRLEASPTEVLRASEGALVVEAEQTMTEAKVLTPVDEGTLRSSGHVRKPTLTKDSVSVEFGFGGPAGTGNTGPTNDKDVGYAVPVHEDLTAHHNPPTQAKYLETPLNRRKARFGERFARRVERRIRRFRS